MNNESFWKWYLRGVAVSLRYIFTFKWAKEPVVEAVGGGVLFGASGIILGICLYPLWLLLILLAPIPFAHGWWREWKIPKEVESEKALG